MAMAIPYPTKPIAATISAVEEKIALSLLGIVIKVKVRLSVRRGRHNGANSGDYTNAVPARVPAPFLR
jgi:hypothetical protein